MTALARIDQIETQAKEISELRRELNELVEYHLPLMWKDGDVRYLNPILFRSVAAKMRKLTDLEDKFLKRTPLQGDTVLAYRGQFGTIYIKEAK